MSLKHWLGCIAVCIVVASAGRSHAAPNASVPSRAFGTHRVLDSSHASTSGEFTLQIASDGDADLVITDITIGGANAGDFELTSLPDISSPIPTGESVEVTIRFNPSQPGPRAATLQVTSNDPTPSTGALTGTGTAAVIAVTDVAFGTVTHGTTATGTITVSNTGSPVGPLRVTKADITGGSWFTFDTNGASNCLGATTCTFAGGGFDVPPNASVGVRCAVPAGAAGSQTATVTFTSDTDPTGDSVAELTCTAGRADIEVDPISLDFGDVLVGSAPQTRTVAVKNTGNQNLVFTASKTGTFAGMYSFSGCSSNCTVAPGAEQQLTVTFTPTAITTPNANITINLASNDPDTATLPVPVTGRGTAPQIDAPLSLAFGTVEVGKMSGLQTLTVTNAGTATLTITNAALTAGATDYTVMSGMTGPQMTMVPPAGTHSWTLVCNPTTHGSRPGTFTITSNSLTGSSAQVGFSCTGQQGQLAVVPASIDFGAVPQGNVVDRTFRLRNTGNVAVTGITGVADPNNVGYSIVGTVPAMLAAGAEVMLTARFAPANATDGGAADLDFTGVWGSTNTPTAATVALSSSTQTSGFELDPAMLAFDKVRFDGTKDLTFCIRNPNQAAINILGPLVIVPGAGTVTGEFTATTIRRPTSCTSGGGSVVNLPQPLAMNQVLVVTVRVDPANRLGMMQATLTVTSDLQSNPSRNLPMTATSTTGEITTDPAAMLDLGSVDVQGPPKTGMITITNTGDGPLDLGSFAVAPTTSPFTVQLPAGSPTLMPGTAIQIPVSYAPTTAQAMNQYEQVTLSHSIAGDFMGPTGQSIVIRGRGIDRKIEVGPAPAFPDTFRNPGDQAPVRPLKLGNTGEAPLRVTSAMVTSDPEVWQIVDPDPVTIPFQANHELLIKFSPKTIGRSEAQLVITNDDDTRSTVTINLVGNGLGRDVVFSPDPIVLGYTAIGVPVTVPDAMIVTSRDPNNTFRIRAIKVDDGSPFTIEDPPENVELPAQSERRFAVTFTPTSQGPFKAKAYLFLDGDPDSQREVTIEGTAVFVDAHGGGGCSVGGSGAGSRGGGAGGMAVVALAALGVLRRRRRARAAAAAAIALVPAGAAAIALAPAAASADNVAISVFDPVPATTSNGYQLQSPDVGKSGDWVVSAVLSHATDPLILSGFTTEGFVNNHAVITRSSVANLGAAVAFLGRFEAGVRMPMYTQDGQPFGDPLTEYTAQPASGTARGDLTLHGKMRLFRAGLEGHGAFSGGLGVQLTLPTASDGQYTGADKPSGRALFLASLMPGAFQNRITLSLNLGGVIRARSTYLNLAQKSGIAWGLGLQVRALDTLWLAGEVYGDMVPSGRVDPDQMEERPLSPIEWLGGLRWKPDHRITVGLAAGRGLTSAIGTPAFRGVLSLTYSPGAPELRPIKPPKIDGDADGDGVRDSVDRCPNEPEDLDLFDDTDGCPDPDNDGDGIPDSEDRCPLEAEDKDGVDDTDGCIDKDNDGDGIPDTLDKCPMQPEDKDGWQDTDGCPDDDNDRDGIPDATDQCINQPETINGKNDDDGCPDKGDSAVVMSPDRLETLDSIQFTTGQKIAKASFNLLGQIGATLRAHSEIVRLRIAVHVHPSDDPDKDQEITDKRAAAVREWLIQWGIAASRLEARGFGGTKPIAPPDSKSSAALNQRIELIILERN